MGVSSLVCVVFIGGIICGLVLFLIIVVVGVLCYCNCFLVFINYIFRIFVIVIRLVKLCIVKFSIIVSVRIVYYCVL